MIKLKHKKLKKRFAMFVLKENFPGKPLLLHEEAIYLNDKLIGKTTSGNYSFNFNKNLSYGYIYSDIDLKDLLKETFYIEVEKIKYEANLIMSPLKKNNYKQI